MKKRSRKILLVFFAIGILLLLPMAYALFTARDIASNDFIIGVNTSHLEENFGRYTSFEKGKSYTKEVSVKNDGTVDCYVRVFAEIEDPNVAAKLTLDFNNTNWTEKQNDGFYYYKTKLKPGDTTVPLFTQITAKEKVSEFQMICYSETVQSYGTDSPVTAFGM